MRRIEYMQTGMGKPAVEEFIDSLDEKVQQKVFHVLRVTRESGIVSSQYFKKLTNSDGIWEVRVQFGNNIYRILAFWGKGNALVLTHGFIKKTQKTPPREIEIAERWKRMYLQTKP